MVEGGLDVGVIVMIVVVVMMMAAEEFDRHVETNANEDDNAYPAKYLFEFCHVVLQV